VNLAFLLSAAAFVVSFFSLFYFKSYLKRRTGQERILSELRDEVNKILKSIDETTDRDISLIEEREKELKSLLEDIEKRLKLYIREMEKRTEAENAYAALSEAAHDKNQTASVSSGPVSPDQGERTYLELGRNRYRINRQKVSPSMESAPEAAPPSGTPHGSDSKSAASLPANPDSAFPLPGFEIKAVPPAGPGNSQTAGKVPPHESAVTPPSTGEQIRELLKAGFSASIIASRLGISIAEVEFAEALLERRES